MLFLVSFKLGNGGLKLFFSPTKCSTVLLLNTCLICSTFTSHHRPCRLAQCVPEIIFKLFGHVPRPTVITHLLLPPQYCGMHSLNTSGNYPMLLSSKAISKLTFSIVLFLYNFLLFCVLLFLLYLAHLDIVYVFCALLICIYYYY